MKKSLFLLICLFAFSANAQDPIYQNFINPPAAAKPRVWWHWMNGNITKEGIQKDLQWMDRSGIGGLMNFDANLFTPVVVKQKLAYMTPEWKDAFKFTTELAKQKKTGISNSWFSWMECYRRTLGGAKRWDEKICMVDYHRNWRNQIQ